MKQPSDFGHKKLPFLLLPTGVSSTLRRRGDREREGRQGERQREGEIATRLNNSFGFRQANQTSLSDVWKKEEEERKLQGAHLSLNSSIW